MPETTVQSEIDREIEEYATKSRKAIRQELLDAGITPEDAVASVKELVQEKLAGRVRSRASAR